MVVLVWVWLLGTLLVAVASGIAAFATFLFEPSTPHRRRSLVASTLIGVTALIANPIANMVLLAPYARHLQADMIEDATSSNAVGRSSDWLVARYGQPLKIVQDSSDSRVQHWWFTPGPAFVLHEDYVGFTVENASVTSVYLQVN